VHFPREKERAVLRAYFHGFWNGETAVIAGSVLPRNRAAALITTGEIILLVKNHGLNPHPFLLLIRYAMKHLACA
jgi:hypothetical protein